MAELPTVRIVNPQGGGFRTINQQDYDSAVHRLYVEPTVVEVSPPQTETVAVAFPRRRGKL